MRMNYNTRISKKVRGIVFILCIFLAGCGLAKQKQQEETVTIGEEWKVKGFARTESLSPSVELPETEYYEVRYSELEKDALFTVYDYCGNSSYTIGKSDVLIKKENDLDEGKQYVLPYGNIVCMDVITEGDIAMLSVTGSGRYSMLHLDAEGNLTSEVDMTDAFMENDIDEMDLSNGYWWCDGEGYSYVAAEAGKKLIVFDREGSCVLTRDYTKEENTELMTAFHAPDGSLIIGLNDIENNKTALLWFDMFKKTEKELAVINHNYLRQFSMQENGDIYYSVGQRLYRWNVNTGEQITLLDYSATDIPSNATEYVEHVTVTDHELGIYIRKSMERSVMVFSNEEREDEEAITLMNFGQLWGSDVKSWAASFSRTNSGVPIRCKEFTGELDDAWNRTMAELAAGKGPDIICIAGQDKDDRMHVLYEKGVLADLSDLVSEETKSQFFPGIIESGSIDGDWVGMIPEALASLLLVSDQLWEDEHWTLEDIFALADNKEQTDRLLIYDNDQPDDMDLLFMLMDSMECMEDIGLIDLEKGESHFDSEWFRRILEATDNYNTEKYAEQDLHHIIASGQCVMRVVNMHVEADVIEELQEFSEGCHFVGYPGQENYVGYWSPYCVLLVNKNSLYKERIGEFLEYMLESETQNSASDAIGVMESVTRNNIYYDEFASPPGWLYRNWRGGINIQKPDGSTYMEELVDVLKNLGPKRYLPNAVRTIIREEARAYYNGERSLDRTIEIIDNRVQLYLDERG